MLIKSVLFIFAFSLIKIYSFGQLKGEYCTQPNLYSNCLTFKDSLKCHYFWANDEGKVDNEDGFYYIRAKDSLLIFNLFYYQPPIPYNFTLDSQKIPSDSIEISLYVYTPYFSIDDKLYKMQIPWQYISCNILNKRSKLCRHLLTDENGLTHYKFKALTKKYNLDITHEYLKKFHKYLSPGWCYRFKIWYGDYNGNRPTLKQIAYKIGKINSDDVELKLYSSSSGFEKYIKKK